MRPRATLLPTATPLPRATPPPPLLLLLLLLLGVMLRGVAPLRIVLWKTGLGPARDAAVQRAGDSERGGHAPGDRQPEEEEEVESFDLRGVRPHMDTGAQLKDKVRAFLSTEPDQQFDLVLPDGRRLDDEGILVNQGVDTKTTLKFVSTAPRRGSGTHTSTTTTADASAPAKPETSSHLSDADIFAAIKRLQHDTVVEGSDGRVWSLSNTVNRAASQTVLSKRRVPSARVLEALYPGKNWVDIPLVDARVLERLTTGPMRVVNGDMGFPQPTTVLRGPIPVRSDLGLECGEHPFAFGVVSAVSFWFRPWMEDAKDASGIDAGSSSSSYENTNANQRIGNNGPRGHRSLFHTYPMVPGTLAPVLMVGDTHELFLGYIDSRSGKEVNLKGVMTRVKFSGRTWEHIAVLFDAKAGTLQLYHNGAIASTPLRVSPPDTGGMPRIAPVQRSLVFGKGKLLQGARGLVDNVMVHYGSVKAAMEIRNEWMYGSASRRLSPAPQDSSATQVPSHLAVPVWLDRISWQLPTEVRMPEPPAAKPKHGLSAFMFFSRERRSALKKSQPDLLFGEVAKVIGKEWKDMKESAKAKYQKLAVEDRVQHENHHHHDHQNQQHQVAGGEPEASGEVNYADGALTMFSLGMALLSAPPPPPLIMRPALSEEDDGAMSLADNADDEDGGDSDIAVDPVPLDPVNVIADDMYATHFDWRARTLYALVSHASRSQKREVAQRNRWIQVTLKSVVDAAVPFTESSHPGQFPCITLGAGWWTYDVCRGRNVVQRHTPSRKKSDEKATIVTLGTFDETLTAQQAPTQTIVGSEEQLVEVYSNGAHCDEVNKPRRSTVVYRCCENEKPRGADPFVLRVEEPNTCQYRIIVCVNTICLKDGRGMNPVDQTLPGSDSNDNIDKKNKAAQPGSTNPARPTKSARASSTWSQIFDANRALDGRSDTFWKATRSSADPKPWILVDLTHEGSCSFGIDHMRLNWDLAPEAYKISIGSRKIGALGQHNQHSREHVHRFTEVVDVARQAQRQRSDYFDAATFSDSTRSLSTRYVNVSITSVGPWTAPSLTEFVVQCKPKTAEIPDGSSDHYNDNFRRHSDADKPSEELDGAEDVLAGPFEPVRTMLSEMASRAPMSGTTPNLGQEGMQRDHRAAVQAFALHILVSEGDDATESSSGRKGGGLASDPSSSPSSSSAEAPRIGPWSSEDAQSGSFLALASYHANGGQHPREELEKLLRSGSAFSSLPPGSCMSAAALYRHEAYSAVGGAVEGSKHPVPIQHLQLSTARNDEIDRHRDSGGDEGQYQQTQADQGDVNAIKWIASRHYHGLNGFDRDLPRAAEYFRQAADAGDAEARYNYAVMRLTGQDGGPANPAIAHRYFEEAAARDFPPALNGLGLRYMGGDYTGQGEPPNYKMAFDYFSRSARQNSADGHYNLAALYKDGQGVEEHIPVALMHFAVAAALGQHRAQWMLGDALHSRSSFLSKWLAKHFGQPERLSYTGAWSNAEKGINISANVSVAEGVHVSVWDMHRGLETTIAFPIHNMSCSHAVNFFRPLAETRAAGSAYRMGVKSWIEGDGAEAERLFQASSWMGLAAGTSNAAWLLRQQYPGLPPPPRELALLGGELGGGGPNSGSDGVDCGGHRAASCAACPQGHGGVWCNGECNWDEEDQRCSHVDPDSGSGQSAVANEVEGAGEEGFLSTIMTNVMSVASQLQHEDARVAAGASRLYALTAGRQDEDAAQAVDPADVSSRDDHAFAYSVQAAVQGDVLEHVVVAAAIHRQVKTFSEEGEVEVAGTAREDAVQAWQGAVESGSPEASSEFGLMYVIGNPSLKIAQNYTKALEHLGSCGGPGVMDQGIGGRPVPLECVPSQLLMWYVRARQSWGAEVVFHSMQRLSTEFGEENVASGLLVTVCVMFMVVGCFL